LHLSACFAASAPQVFVLIEGVVEKPHPSEEGEALQEIGQIGPISFHPVRTSRRLIRNHLPDEPQPSKWFALYTTSRHEKRVARHLRERQIEFYLPLYRLDRKWRDGSRVTLELPLFPGYLFIHIRRNDRVRVLEVPGALAVVSGTGGEPSALPDATIEALREGLELRPAQPHPFMTAGQRVRIRSGALAGFEGIVVRNKSSFRVVLTLEHIMQSYAVEVDLGDLEPLTPGDLPFIATPELQLSRRGWR
jgi:transcriptional antiterminator NusG